MALPYRHRAALLLVGALVSTPVWTTAAAATPTIVTFSGHQLRSPGALSCSSTPSIARISVPAGTTIDFANKLGEGATLWAGDSHKHLNDGEMVPVTFSTGPVDIVMQMLPDCSLDLGTHDQMTVTVTAPAPAGGPVVTPTGKSGKPKSPKSDKSGPRGVAGGNGGGLPGAGPTGNGAPTPPADTDGSVTLGDPIGAAEPRHEVNGLLTLIATVCVVGVTAAAIRAIIAQRAARTIAA